MTTHGDGLAGAGGQVTCAAVLRWVFADELAHVLAVDADDSANDLPAYVTECGLGMPATVPVYGVPPSLDVCRVCVRLPGDDGPAHPGSLTVPPPVPHHADSVLSAGEPVGLSRETRSPTAAAPSHVI